VIWAAVIVAAALAALSTADDRASTRAALAAGATEATPLYRAAGKHWALVRVLVTVGVVGCMVATVALSRGVPVVEWAVVLAVVAWSLYVFRVARRNWANAATLTQLPTAPASPRMDLAGEGGHTPRGRSGDTDGRH
jgi:Flp pilus assembly protein TadB